MGVAVEARVALPAVFLPAGRLSRCNIRHLEFVPLWSGRESLCLPSGSSSLFSDDRLSESDPRAVPLNVMIAVDDSKVCVICSDDRSSSVPEV